MKSQDGTVHFVMIAIYVDDMLFFSKNIEMLEKKKREILKEFQVKDLGELHYVVGMSIVRDREKRTMSITQKKYLEGVLKKFDMENCKPVSTPLGFCRKMMNGLTNKCIKELLDVLLMLRRSVDQICQLRSVFCQSLCLILE